MIEIEQHDDAGLGIETRKGDESNPNRGAHVVAEQPEQPERTHKRERHCQEHDTGFHD